MSYFLRSVRAYCDRHDVTPADRTKLLLHYPLFKLCWLAPNGGPLTRAIASRLTTTFRGYRMWHSVAAPSGRLRVPVSFHPEDLASFKEVFLENEYRAPFDLSSARTYVDLGANTGMAALFFASQAPLERLILVEANPALQATLRRNVARALGPDRVTIEHAAVGAGADALTFYVSEDHRLSSTRPIPGARAVTVAGTSLAALLDASEVQSIDILKMDIEGAEHDVLESDPGAVARARFLFAEVHGADPERDRFAAAVTALGFQVAERRGQPGGGGETLVARR